ncbi:MAG TPA: histidine kinase [Herbaspirillum sp.]
MASVFILPAQADNNSRNRGHSGGSDGSGTGSGTAPSANSTSTATGGSGGNGGNGTGGSATGGSATGGNATGGAATGGRSNANGNTSTVSVSLTNSGGSSASGSSDPNAATTVRYDGSYTVKSAPPIAAPSLTSTFSDTCMGSSSFGLSFVGFGATGGTTMVDEACVRRLDSREFRAMGLNDVALALLCQSAANKKAVEATGRACPSATSNETAAVQSSASLASMNEQAPVNQQASLTLAPETPLPAAAPQAPLPAAAPQAPQAPQALEVPQQPDNGVAAIPEPVPAQASMAAVEISPLSDEAGGK